MLRKLLALFCLMMPVFLFVTGFSTLVGPGKGWQSLPMNMIVDRNGHRSVEDFDGGLSSVIDAVNSQSTGWNAALNGVVNAYSGNTGGGSQGDGVATMNFIGSSACSGNCVAVTFPLINARGIMIDADIYVNDQVDFSSVNEPSCAGEIFIEATMVHEVGHALGLGHAGFKYLATMFYAVPICSNYQASIASDDARGILYIY